MERTHHHCTSEFAQAMGSFPAPVGSPATVGLGERRLTWERAERETPHAPG